MAYTKQLLYEPIRSIDSATFTGAFQAIGGPLLHPASIVKLVNTSASIITVSIDGTTTVDVAPGASFFLYDITSNSPIRGDDAIFVPQGRQYYVSGAVSTGLVYLVVQYIVQV
jgi:hypothetical protein